MADSFRFAQLQPFLLAGSGAIIGDVAITLQSMVDIDGNALSMSNDFGLIGYGTLEPGNGTLEEQVSFTGLTNNTNGTVTLSGISNVAFLYPYTQTSGLLKTHAGATTFIISNTSGFYSKFVAKDDDGLISETLTFTNPAYPQINTDNPEPTLNTQLVPKSYVDGVAIAGAPNANTTTKGIVQIATQAQVDARTLIGSTSAYLLSPLNAQRSTLLSDYVIDTSTSANIIIIAPSPAISAYTAGQTFSFKVANTNTSTSVSLNVNGLGAKSIVKLNGSTSPSVSDIALGQVVIAEYNGTNFQLQTPVANAPVAESEMVGVITMYGGSVAPTNWLLCNGSAVSRTTYASLFTCIASAYGNGDGSTTFNVPNMLGKFVAGPSAFLSLTLGATGGAAAQVVGPFTLNSGSAVSNTTPVAFASTTNSVSVSIIPPYVITNYIIHA